MTDSTLNKSNTQQAGFTLIELLVVLVILGLLAGMVGPKVVSYLSRGKTDTAKLQIEQLAAAMDLYLLDVGRYPTRDEGINALLVNNSGAKNWRGPYLRKDELPLDPWGNEFHYEPPGESGNFELYSLGADNAEGGEGDNADITL
ncbi:MAG: type II secretion system major pseudopilin GspG [Gammaproteobacteria bacterium]|nr:type II secretion system major pseudopilin GspG [Gammaproteobacteria bacterium]MCP5408878.1 type II secretion system major pseudopilin GspG [Chromatiaceae bacterium]